MIRVDAAVQDPDVVKTLRDTAIEADRYLIAPMMRWSVNGKPAANGWTSPANNAAFGGAVKAGPLRPQVQRDDDRRWPVAARRLSIPWKPSACAMRRAEMGQSFAFINRRSSGGSERRYRPFGENGSAAHGSRLRARFLVFHTSRWDVSLLITRKRPFGHVKAVHTTKRPFSRDNASRRPDPVV